MNGSGDEAAHSGATAPVLRVPTHEEVRAILAAHALWLDSQGREGDAAVFEGLDLSGLDLRGARLRRADLHGLHAPGADLTGADLHRANLRDADLSEARLVRACLVRADLTGADLSGSNFQGADLARCELGGARLRQAVLRDAVFVDANLGAARGLLPGQLGGTNLTGASLPAEIARFEGLTNVAEASKATQNLFTSILFVCAYTWLTIASATDAQLVNDAAPPSSRLPILGIDIPVVRFFIASPLLLVCLYVYFHLMLQRLWEELAELPAVFPDGRAVDKKAYPWLLNVLVRAHVPRLRESRSHLAKWQARLSSLLAWGLVPGTVLLAWARYLHAHDWCATAVHVACLSAAIGAGIAFLRLAAATLRGSERRAFHWQRAWRDARALCAIVTLGTAAVAGWFSFGVIEGVNPQSVYDLAQTERLLAEYRSLDARRWVPWLLGHLHISSSAALADAPLSIRPANWSPTNPELLSSVKGADLERRRFTRNLRHAMAFNAFCVNAYFQESDLRWADFRSADLRGADFRRAWLEGINFRFSNLARADFRNADLARARIKEASAELARFQDANLAGAVLSESDLQGANFSRANLAGADLSKAKLGPDRNLDPRQTKATVLEGTNLTAANLQHADLTSASLQPAATGTDSGAVQRTLLIQAQLRGATLSGANLTAADLTGADLTDAILTTVPDILAVPDQVRPTVLAQARLDSADLSRADLTGADLRGASLRAAKLQGTRLDRVHLAGADLTGATGLTAEQLATAHIDAATILPEGIPELAGRPHDEALH